MFYHGEKQPIALAGLNPAILGLIPSFSTNPFHRSLPFLQDWLHRFPGLFTDTSVHIRFYFLVLIFSFWFGAED